MRLPDRKQLEEIYGEGERSLARYRELMEHFRRIYHREEAEFFSAPGRTELIGNHTDHNGGKVLAAGIDMDTVGAAWPNDSRVIRITSEGCDGEILVELDRLEDVKKGKGSRALVAGLTEGLCRAGFQVSGFDAYVSSNVIAAAGVSSSASFEMLICTMINCFFNNGAMDCADCARAGQYAENVYWNKASGMMDQMACAVGGTILMDFAQKDRPACRKVAFSFQNAGYGLVIVNTGGGHADLGREYSEVPLEMKEAAVALQVERLCEVGLEDLLAAGSRIPNDRAFLRAMHFFRENDRVLEVARAMETGNISGLLRLIRESGRSSWELLQNCYSLLNCREQKVTRTLALTELFLERTGDGACRVHGGGFAGVILCILPRREVPAYTDYISGFVGAENVFPMKIREAGALRVGC